MIYNPNLYPTKPTIHPLHKVKQLIMNIINVISPNFTQGRKNYKPEAIVIHIMAGTLPGTDNWFATSQSSVSAHYGIGREGNIHAYVSETNTAWHTGRVNNPSWGLIKPAGNGLYINPNYYTIGIEHEGSEDSEWTPEMYETSAALIRDICARWSIPLDRNHIIGHHEIFSLKTCPGHKVDLNKLITLAGGNPQTASVVVPANFTKVVESGKVTSKTKLNLRPQPDTAKQPVNTIAANVQLAYDGYTLDGEKISGNGKWYFTNEGNWFWSGAVTALVTPPINTTVAASLSDQLTVLQVKGATGANMIYATKFLPFLIDTCAEYSINTPARRLCFLAQLGHESGGLFFTEELASGKAYEGRSDLGNIHAGDGVRYKGRGLIQISGRDNYTTLSADFKEDFIAQPQRLGGKNINVCTPQQMKYAALSAGWFWDKKNLNNLADKIDLRRPVAEGDNLRHYKDITLTINGGYNGLQDRVNRFINGVAFF